MSRRRHLLLGRDVLNGVLRRGDREHGCFADARRRPCPGWRRRTRPRRARRHGRSAAHHHQAHNQRLYRIARGVRKDDSEAEDIVQEAYVRAFAHLDAVSRRCLALPHGCRASSSTRRSAGCARGGAERWHAARPQAEIIRFPLNPSDDPERTMAQRQILDLVERATDACPMSTGRCSWRASIEGMSIEETAEAARHAARNGQDKAAPRPGYGAQANWTTRSARCCSMRFRSPAGAANG